MVKLHFSTFINAPREKVWDLMLSDTTYRDWTSVFMEGSYYKGDWQQGSKILFLAPGKDGKGEGGMVSRIVESRRPEFVSIEHLGMVEDGIEDIVSEKVKAWAGAHENYTFSEQAGGTELVIDMDVSESEQEYMQTAWEKALVKLKALAEA